VAQLLRGEHVKQRDVGPLIGSFSFLLVLQVRQGPPLAAPGATVSGTPARRYCACRVGPVLDGLAVCLEAQMPHHGSRGDLQVLSWVYSSHRPCNGEEEAVPIFYHSLHGIRPYYLVFIICLRKLYL
jgi:hypothetical protein